jgi:hypothetical protein
MAFSYLEGSAFKPRERQATAGINQLGKYICSDAKSKEAHVTQQLT